MFQDYKRKREVKMEDKRTLVMIIKFYGFYTVFVRPDQQVNRRKFFNPGLTTEENVFVIIN